MVKLKIYKLASVALALGIMGACKPAPATLTNKGLSGRDDRMHDKDRY